jgi:NAD(P)-dependent dehydrogenase (short-subunit alcohol dehydrogenase family)
MTTDSDRWPMRGRTALVTGGTGGIGYQTARALAQSGARVLITGRQVGPGERAAAAIRRDSGHELVRFLPADHATVGGNQQLADQVRGASQPLGCAGQQRRRPVPEALGDRRRL